MAKKLLVFISLLMITLPSFSAYNEIECSTNPIFSENSCNQCFDGNSKIEGDHLGLLSDLWMNVTDVAKILYKEEQVDPEMVNLDPANVSWVQTPTANGFWEYTDELDALYSDMEEGYVLEAGSMVTWIKSSLSHAYKLDTNTAIEGTDIGLLVYPMTTHNILADGEITIDNTVHNECVLFTSGRAEEIEEVVVERLPETGPAEFMLLIIVAMILGFGFLQLRARS
ncbi:MAG: hypothetical protein QM490_03960 [Candidatus Gracilibacteria bacterium]